MIIKCPPPPLSLSLSLSLSGLYIWHTALQGGRDIMKLMGYTEDIQDGLQFPNSVQTNEGQLIRLLADIMCGKRELDAYLTNYHPFPERVEILLPHQTV